MTEEKTSNQLMSEAEFINELKGSLLILTTSSPDKRDVYRLLFSSHAKDADHYAGLDVYYTDSGALGIAPRKTPEKGGEYDKNLDEKALQQLVTLQVHEVQENIRLKLMAGGGKGLDPQQINIMGMTEDSGWALQFDTKEKEKQFIEIIIKNLKPKLRDKDFWLLEKIDETGFPGPNLKPIQEHLEGGFHELMEMIYDAAGEIGVKELRFSNSTNVSFVSPRLGKFFPKEFRSTGRLLTREEYEDRLMGTKRGEAINSNFVQIPDGQEGDPKTIDVLINAGLHTKSSVDVPASYARRELTEYLQKIIGKRRSSIEERKRHVSIACVSPDSVKGTENDAANIKMPRINDFASVGLPTHAQLMDYPGLKVFDDADVIVLIPEERKITDNRLNSDPNLGLLLNFIVTAETDPLSMGIPIILDNRSRGFDRALELISNAFAQGRLMGDPPFYVVNDDKELRDTLVLIKDVKQRAPLIRTPSLGQDNAIKRPMLQRVGNDGVFTVFIGGGHANNSKRDLEDAKAFGYYCAENGWRIITGAGSVEGSMGAVHTGFIQYHLDRIHAQSGLEGIKASLNEFMDAAGKYDAEEVILQKPNLIEELANKGHIPRNMFYGYSMKALLEMESPSGTNPPGITYFESGNRIRRLAGLLAAGTKVFLPGSIGTDEEFEATIAQHLDARLRKQNGVANESVFSDGTPDNEGVMIIYNRNHLLDKLLAHYGLANAGDPIVAAKRRHHNIIVVDSLDQLKHASSQTASSWLERVRRTKEGNGQNLAQAS